MADDRATKPKEQAKLMEQREGKGSDDSHTELASPFKYISPKIGGRSRSDDSTIKLAGPSKSMEEKEEKRSGDSTAKLAGPSKISERRDQELVLHRQRILMEISERRDQELVLHRQRILMEMSELHDEELDLERQMISLEISELRDQELDLQRRMSLLEISKTADQDSSVKCESKELEGVLLHTRRLTVCDSYQYTPFRHGREGKKSAQDTFIRGDAGLKLHVEKWMSTGDETCLVLRDAYFLGDYISILAPLCTAVKHISIDLRWIHLHPYTPMPMPIPITSVITVCLKSIRWPKTFHEALQAVSNLFPNAESLDMQMEDLSSLSNQAQFPEVNSTSSLRELKLKYRDRYLYDVPTNSLFLQISTSCPNIVSLVLSGFGRWLSNKSSKFNTSCKFPRLTSIHLEPFGTDDCCRFETLPNVLHEVHVTSPHLKLVEANKVQLGYAELTGVKWSRTSSGCELQLEGASAAVPMADLMHLVSNELVGVTVLTFDRCKVDFPQSISHPSQGTGGESSLRELRFLNVKCPLFQADILKLPEMYPNVKVTVEHESQASHKDSEQGTRMLLKPDRKTLNPSSPPSATSSIDWFLGATARVQVHEEEEEEEEYYIAMESLPHDGLVRATARVQVHEEQTDTQNTKEEEDHIAMENLPHETDEVNVKPIKMECCKRVGVEGGKLQLDSFGIELQIPPGAIDSETPQDISLRVLTDTPNIGNSKKEMSVCFGVQCLAPYDLVLKLPVTYTIPHCAVITRYSSVNAVLYTGEGEYSPDAVVKERIILSRSGTPSCTITKDVLELKMDHFSWLDITFLKNFFFRTKKMCCWPFKEKNLTLQKTPVILHAHLFDAIEGKSELIKRKEGELEYVPAVMEQEVLINTAEGHLKMTCYVEGTVLTAVVSFDRLMGGAMISEHFVLDFPNQPDSVLVLLKVGQDENLENKLKFRLDFSTPHRIERASQQDQGQLQGSQTLQSSHRSKGGIIDNIAGRQEDFDEKLKVVAQRVVKNEEIDNLGKDLGFKPEDIRRYIDTNTKNAEVSYWGTLTMLRDWRKKQTEATECEALKSILKKAGQIHLAGELFDELVGATSRVQALIEWTDTQNTDEEERKEEEEEEEDEYFMAMESLLNETDMTTLIS